MTTKSEIKATFADNPVPLTRGAVDYVWQMANAIDRDAFIVVNEVVVFGTLIAQKLRAKSISRPLMRSVHRQLVSRSEFDRRLAKMETVQ